MMDLLSKCESLGNSLSLEGDGIRVENIALLPDGIKKEIIRSKSELIEALKRDTRALDNGILIGIPGTLYTFTISRFSSAYVEYVGGEWIAIRETYKPGKSTPSTFKVISRGNTFDYVFNEFMGYKNFLDKKKIQEVIK